MYVLDAEWPSPHRRSTRFEPHSAGDEREMLEYRPQLRGHDLETTTEGQVKVTTLEDVSLDNPDYLKDMVRILHSQLEESQNTQRITR